MCLWSEIFFSGRRAMWQMGSYLTVSWVFGSDTIPFIDTFGLFLTCFGNCRIVFLILSTNRPDTHHHHQCGKMGGIMYIIEIEMTNRTRKNWACFWSSVGLKMRDKELGVRKKVGTPHAGRVLATSMYRMLVQKSDNKLFIMVDIINIVTWFW